MSASNPCQLCRLGSFMPIHNHIFANAGTFELTGPVVDVLVEVPTALAASLATQKQQLPKPVPGLALVDTGATASAVDLQVIQQLGVQPVSVANVATPTGAQSRPLFPGRFTFPGTNVPAMDFQALIGADLSLQKIHGMAAPLVALLGRDILKHFVLVYNGPSGWWSLSS